MPGFASRLAISLAGEPEEEPSPIAIGIAVTLLGSISFQMGLLYLTNHSDRDMRRYSYGVINQTVSIFCAVLMFQTFDDIVEQHIDGWSMEMQAVADMLHMLFWFTILQLVLMYIAGVSLWSSEREEVTRKLTVSLQRHQEFKKEKEEAEKKPDQREMKCYSVLLAHLTGFASINAWGAVQQLSYFRSPLMSLMVVPVSALGQLALQRATDWVRETKAAGDGEKDEREKCWDEECEEAENDVMGLTLSFNLVQAVRFCISGSLPGQDGKEEPDVLYFHTLSQSMQLLICGFSCIPLMIVIYLRLNNKEGEGGDDDSEISESDAEELSDEEEELSPELLHEPSKHVQALRRGFWHYATIRHFDEAAKHYELEWDDGTMTDDTKRRHKDVRELELPQVDQKVFVRCGDEWVPAQVRSKVGDEYKLKTLDNEPQKVQAPLADIAMVGEEQKEEEESLTERLLTALTITFAMAFAWCSFYSAQMGLATSPLLRDPMVLSVVLTLFISAASFSCIRILDVIDDFCTGAASFYVARSALPQKFYLAVDGDKVRPAKDEEKRASFVVDERQGKKGDSYVTLIHGQKYVTKDGDLTTKRAQIAVEKKTDTNGRARVIIARQPYDLFPKGGCSNSKVKNIDLILKKIIRALGILVGFGWEQCFDEAVESLSEVLPNPHLSRFFLALFCIVIIVPAWKWYVLPMSEQAGWKFGFVVDHQDDKLVDIFSNYTRQRDLDPTVKHAANRLLQAIAHGGTMEMKALMSAPMGSQAKRDTMAFLCSSIGTGIDDVPAADARTPLLGQPQPQPQLPPPRAAADSPLALDVSGARSPLSDGSALSPRGAAVVSAELQTLRDTNVQLRLAADGFLDLYVKLRETSGEDRRCLLRTYNQQMDSMLTRMRDLQATVAKGRSASPSPAARRFGAGGAFP